MDLTILNYASYVSSDKPKARESVLKGIKPKTLDWGRQVGVDHTKTNVDEESSIDIIINDETFWWINVMQEGSCVSKRFADKTINTCGANTFSLDKMDLWRLGLGLI